MPGTPTVSLAASFPYHLGVCSREFKWAQDTMNGAWNPWDHVMSLNGCNTQNSLGRNEMDRIHIEKTTGPLGCSQKVPSKAHQGVHA